VLTKVDLMDAGTDAREVLSGRVVYLKRGFVPLVARSQRDIADGMPIDRALARERLFFERHPAYRAFASRCGAAYLTRVLSHMLLAAIKQWLPRVRTEVSLMLQYGEQQLSDLGPSVEAIDMAAAGQTVLRLLTRYASNYCDMLDGRTHADAHDDMLTQVLFGGARIQEHIRSRFYKAVEDWMCGFVRNAHTTLPSAEILMALRNSSGPRPTLFIPEQAFVALARRYVKTLKEQGRRFVQYVYDELRRVADQCQPPELTRFGDLRERAVEVVHDLLRRAFAPTLAQVDALIDFELAHINTLHPDFVGAEGAMRAVRAADDRDLFYRPGAPFDAVYEEEDTAAAAARAGGDEAGGLAGDDDADPMPELGPGVAAAGGRSMPPDVEWALQQLGGVLPVAATDGAVKRPSRAARGPPVALNVDASLATKLRALRRAGVEVPTVGGGGDDSAAACMVLGGGEDGGSDAGSGATVATNDSIRDVAERFASHIVADIAGHGPDDPLPAGAVRVGGKHSPYIAQPVLAAAGAGAGAAMPASYAGMSAVMSAPGYQLAGPGGAAPHLGSAGSEYVHYAVMPMPSRPLPPVITPADLKPTRKEKVEVRVIRYLLFSYLQIVKKTYQVRAAGPAGFVPHICRTSPHPQPATPHRPAACRTWCPRW